MNPHQVTRDFEAGLCAYTGSPYAVAVTSCTAALMLAVAWHLRDDTSATEIEIPRRTYVSVPQAIIHAGGCPTFRDEAWEGYYRLAPLPVWDSARWFTSDLWRIVQRQADTRPFVCVSFHWSKTLAIGQGGAILHDNTEAHEWFRRARFDGRTPGVAPKDDVFDFVGWHCYMSPRDAADGLSRLAVLPKHNAPLPNDDYVELDKWEVFR